MKNLIRGPYLAHEKLRTLVMGVVSVCLVGYAVYLAGPVDLYVTLVQIDLKWFAISLGTGAIALVVSARKWQILLRAKGQEPSFYDSISTYYVAGFINLFVPSIVGGDAYKVYGISKHIETATEAFSSVVVERLSGLISLVALASVAVSVHPEYLDEKVLPTFSLVLVGTVFVTVFLYFGTGRRLIVTAANVVSSGLGERLGTAYRSIQTYRDEKSALIWALGLSLLFQVLSVVVYYQLVIALRISVPIEFLFVLVPLTEVLLVAPISVNGYGVREVLYILFLSGVGVEPTQAVALAFLVNIHNVVKFSGAGLLLVRT